VARVAGNLLSPMPMFPLYHTQYDFAIATVSQTIRIVSRLNLCRLYRLHRLQQAIRNHSLTIAIEILEAEGFYGDGALVMLAYLQMGGCAL